MPTSDHRAEDSQDANARTGEDSTQGNGVDGGNKRFPSGGEVDR